MITDDPWAAMNRLDHVEALGTTFKPGDRVRLRPGGRADIFDMELDGKLAVIEGIEVSRLFGCGESNGTPQCDQAQVDAGAERLLAQALAHGLHAGIDLARLPVDPRLAALRLGARRPVGLQPREELGPALIEGKRYTLVIDKAWEDANGSTGVWDIRAMNLKTRKMYLLSSSARYGPPPSPVDFPAVDLSGNVATWNYTTCVARCSTTHFVMRSFIVTQSLPHGRPRTVASTSGECIPLWPSLSGRYIVWFTEGTCGGHKVSDVFLRDRHTGRTRHPTHHHQSSEAATNGPFVAWMFGGSRCREGELILFAPLTGRSVGHSLPIRRC